MAAFFHICVGDIHVKYHQDDQDRLAGYLQKTPE